MKLAWLFILAGFILMGCPNNSEHHDLHFSKGLHCGSFKSQEACPASCHWNGAACTVGAHESKCSDLSDETSCRSFTVGGKKCHWKNNEPTCRANPKSKCTLSQHGSYCCAGTDTECRHTDPRCVLKDPILMGSDATCHLQCHLNPEKQFCCLEGNGECMKPNPNCIYELPGACIEEPRVD